MSDLIQALSRLAGNRHSDGTSSIVSQEDRTAIINGCHDLMLAARQAPADHVMAGKFSLGDRVRKTKGSSWQGCIVGFYSTELTPIGYAVESEREPGSVQIYPEAALAKLEDQQ